MLQIKNLIGGYTSCHNILQGIHLDLLKGDSVGIIGLNGSGKSSLARAIMNLLPFRNGTILLHGEDISAKTTEQLTAAGIVLFMQGGCIFDELTVEENLHLASFRHCKLDSQSFNNDKSLNMFPMFQSKKLWKQKADKLSGGERHQLALAMCLLQQPHLLILDEPSAGLSPHAIDEIYKILENFRRQRQLTVLLIEQNIARAMQFCCSVNMLKDGKITYNTSSKDLKEIEKIMFNE